MKIFKFGASWCHPCKTYEPIFNKVTKEFPNLEVAHYDCEEDDVQELIEKFQIRNLPTTVIITDTNEVIKFSGVPSESELRSKITDVMN